MKTWIQLLAALLLFPTAASAVCLNTQTDFAGHFYGIPAVLTIQAAGGFPTSVGGGVDYPLRWYANDYGSPESAPKWLRDNFPAYLAFDYYPGGGFYNCEVQLAISAPSWISIIVRSAQGYTGPVTTTSIVVQPNLGLKRQGTITLKSQNVVGCFGSDWGGGCSGAYRETIINILQDGAVPTDAKVVDPNPTFLDSRGDLLADFASAKNLTVQRTAVAADGVTKLVVAMTSDQQVQFSIIGPSGGSNGSFSELGKAGAASQSVSVSPQGGVVAAAYTAPPYLKDLDARDIIIRLTKPFVTGFQVDLPLKIVRPPVVLVHGLWSKKAIWLENGQLGAMPDALKAKGIGVFLADYESTNAKTFDPGAPGSRSNSPGVHAVEDAIDRAVETYRSKGIALTQVDVVGHSMGGLMTRAAIQQPDYKRPSNFNKGSIRRLITIGTPHLGTPLARFLLADTNSTLLGIAETHGLGPTGEGAVADLRTGSVALDHLTATPVKAHAIASDWATGGKKARDSLTDTARLLSLKLSLTLEEIFGTGGDDLIVPRVSQYGGLTGKQDVGRCKYDSCRCRQQRGCN
jgi:pimeloyl-ACP methyl ester carboxylesterase